VRRTAYQILSVSRSMGHTDIIPDTFIYGTLEQAEKDIKYRLNFFEEKGELTEFKGIIKTLKDIQEIFLNEEASITSFIKENTELYIYEVEVFI
jgi:DNA/RNA endonuclease YhcR with UshA esterase domain